MKIAYVILLLIIATTLEASGDAIIRLGLYKHTGYLRAGLFLAGAGLLFGYGTFLNLAPIEFNRVVGLYIATLFAVWQVTKFVAFKTVPSLPIPIGGGLIVAGGVVVTFWRAVPLE